MKYRIAPMALFVGLSFFAVEAAFAANPHTATGTSGQPNQSCQDLPGSPGSASAAPGSAFNEEPGGKAGSVYAGTQPQNSKNPKSVAQYDVACFQNSQAP